MIKKLFFISLLALSTNHIFADATDDLFAAIEKSDVDGVKKALAGGANVLRPRADNHTPLSLVHTKRQDILKSAIIPLIASLGLYVAAILHNPKVGIISTAAAIVIANIETSNELAKVVQACASTAFLGLVAKTAWESKSKILPAISTAGLGILLFQVFSARSQGKICLMVYDAAQEVAISNAKVESQETCLSQ